MLTNIINSKFVANKNMGFGLKIVVWLTMWRNPNFWILWDCDSWILHHGIHWGIQTMILDFGSIGILCLTLYHLLDFQNLIVGPWFQMLLVELCVWFETLILIREVHESDIFLWCGGNPSWGSWLGCTTCVDFSLALRFLVDT